jgi:hypothetical protein
MDLRKRDFVSVHTAESEPEAMVIRSLLEANGIHSPGPELVNPLLLKGSERGFQTLEVYALEAQADAARCTISEYLEANASDFSDLEDETARPITSIDGKPRPKIS